MRWKTIELGLVPAAALLAIAIGSAAVTGALGRSAAGPAVAPDAVAAAAPPPASADAAAATSEPVGTDSEQIQGVLARFARAIRSGDVGAMDACIVVTPDEEGALVKAMVLDNMAVRHLQNAWAAKFDQQPMTFPGVGFVWFAPPLDGGLEVLIDRTLQNVDESEIRVIGDAARVPIRLGPNGPAGVIVGPEAAPDTSGFANAWIALVRDRGAWKVNMSKTLRVTVRLPFKRGRQPLSSEQELQVATAFKADLCNMLNATAASIENGQITTAGAAAHRVEAETFKLFNKHGLNGISFGCTPASPISVESPG